MNQPIPANLTKIGSIHDSANICAIENILTLTVKFLHTTPPVLASLVFTYGRASEPPSLSHESSSESAIPKGNPKPRENPPNRLLNVPADPDSDPSFLDYSSLDSSD